MTKILVTGGAGFIGSHTASRFADQGLEVMIYDSFQSYVRPNRFRELNLAYRFEELLKGIDIVRGSTRNANELRRVVSKFAPDRIVHFAALPIASIALGQSDEAFGAILCGTVNLLEVVRDQESVTRLVYISSSMVYGDFEQDPMAESGATNPKEIYGSLKLAGEILVRAYSRCYGFGHTIIRPSAVYGPGDVNRRVLQIFVEAALEGKTLVVHGPETRLDFSYVQDVAQGVVLATLESSGENQTFNITRGEARSLREVIEILGTHFQGVNVKVRQDMDDFRPKRGALDIRLAKEHLGYDPQYSLESGLAEYIEFEKNLCLS